MYIFINMIIYKTTNKVNGKFYVGKDERNEPTYLGSGLILNRAIEKYGKENFEKEIIETCSNKKELSEREIFWISELSATTVGYNIALGGAGGDTYSRNPNLPKIIEKFTGENNHFYGKTHSDETKKKIGLNKLGKPSWNSGKTGIYSDETKEKMSKARDKYKGVNHPRYIEINKEELEMILKENTIKKTAEHFNISVSCLRSRMKLYNINKKKGAK